MSELLSTTEDPVVKEEPPDEVKYEPDSWGVLKAEPSEEATVKDEVDLEPIKFVPVEMQYVMPSCKKEETSGETERDDDSDQELQDSDENDSYEQTEDYQGTESSEEIEDSVGIDEIPDSNSYTAPRVQVESGTGRKQQPDSPYYKFSTSQVQPEIRKLEIPRKCNICKKIFALKANYYSHIKTHVAEPTTSRASYSVEPQDDCESDTPYSSISDQVDARIASVDDNDSRSHRCDTCNKYFKNRNQLEIHTMTHTGEIPYTCDETSSNNNSNIKLRSNLKTHDMKTHTGQRPVCEVSNNLFISDGELKQYTRSRTGERPFNSEVCDKQVIINFKLKQRTRTHTGERPFKCQICNKCFNQSKYLIRHIKTHTDERSYHCDVCNQRFSSNGNLNQHTRTRTDERPFECQICNKWFTQSSHLIRHMRTHTGERPYHCKVCNKSFITNSELKQHTRSHTGERPFERQLCNKCFVHFNKIAYFNKT